MQKIARPTESLSPAVPPRQLAAIQGGATLSVGNLLLSVGVGFDAA
jgi:hypothetical protein